MAYIQTQIPELSSKPADATGLMGFFKAFIRRLTTHRSGLPKVAKLSEQELKTLGQVQPNAQRPYARSISADVATELAMRANGHSMLR